MVGPMTRPGARGLGPGLGFKYDNCVAGPGRAGPGHTFLRAGPGPGLIIQFAGRARAGSVQLLRARAGPGPKILFAGRAWAYISGPCRALVHGTLSESMIAVVLVPIVKNKRASICGKANYRPIHDCSSQSSSSSSSLASCPVIYGRRYS